MVQENYDKGGRGGNKLKEGVEGVSRASYSHYYNIRADQAAAHRTPSVLYPSTLPLHHNSVEGGGGGVAAALQPKPAVVAPPAG